MITGNTLEMATSNPNAYGNAWASVSAVVGTSYQILGFSGGSSTIGCTIDVLIGGKIRHRYFQSPSGGALSEWWGELGYVTGKNSSVAIHADTFNSVGLHVSANLQYRVVL